MNINGNASLCIDFGDNEFQRVVVVWDNGDYILELFGDLSKNQLIELAKTAKDSKIRNEGYLFKSEKRLLI